MVPVSDTTLSAIISALVFTVAIMSRGGMHFEVAIAACGGGSCCNAKAAGLRMKHETASCEDNQNTRFTNRTGCCSLEGTNPPSPRPEATHCNCLLSPWSLVAEIRRRLTALVATGHTPPQSLSVASPDASASHAAGSVSGI